MGRCPTSLGLSNVFEYVISYFPKPLSITVPAEHYRHLQVYKSPDPVNALQDMGQYAESSTM